MNVDLIAGLERAGLSSDEAKSGAAKFHSFGYALTKDCTGTGDHLVQSDDQLHFMINRLLRRHSPLKHLSQSQVYDLFRNLALEGYRIALPEGPLPVVP